MSASDGTRSLVDRAYQGDYDALEELLVIHQPALTRFARRYCATHQDLEDAVQDALWTITRKLHTLRSTTAFVSWTFQLIKNACYALLRTKYGVVNISDLPPLELIDSLNAVNELTIALRNDLTSALAQLPIAQRQVLIMRDLHGMTAPEVAEVLNITVETVKSRLHRGRETLRTLLTSWQEAS